MKHILILMTLTCVLSHLPVKAEIRVASGVNLAPIEGLLGEHVKDRDSEKKTYIQPYQAELRPKLASASVQKDSNIADPPLSDDYRARVASLRGKLLASQIIEIPAIEIAFPPSGHQRASTQVKDQLEESVTWWYEGSPRTWYVHLLSSSKYPIYYIQFAITPGPARAPTGPTVISTMRLDSPIYPGQAVVVTFQTPSGSVDNLDVQDCAVYAAWVK